MTGDRCRRYADRVQATVRRRCAGAVLAATTALRHVRDDPVHFALQLGQRFPGAVARPAAHLLEHVPHHSAPAWAAWMRGDRDDALARLERALRDGARPGRADAALALAADRPDLVPGDAATPLARARAAWQRGDLTAAIGGLADARGGALAYRRVLEGERELLRPGMRLGELERPPAAGRPPQAASPAASAGDDAGTPPRILHLLTNSLPHTQSGYAVRSHEVLRAQREAGLAVLAVTRLGYPVTVGRLGAAASDVVDGVRYRRLLSARLAATPPARLRQQLRLLRPLARDFAPDVVHTTTHYVNAIVARALADELGVPWVYEVRGMLEKTWAASRGTDAARRAAIASERFALVHAREAELAAVADHVFTLSATMRDELIARGVPAGRISLVPNAIDASLLALPPGALPPATNGGHRSPGRDDHGAASNEAADAATIRDAARAWRRRLGLPEGDFWVGAVSSLVGYEGHDVLIEAVALLRARGRDVRLLLAGDGVARPALERRVRECGLAEAATFTGRVPREHARALVRALDAVVVARHDLPVTRSVTPLKPIEAMALGRPVVVSDVPPLRELAGAGDERRALMVEPGSPGRLACALERLAHDEGLGAALVERGRGFAATRTWQANAATALAAYRGLSKR